MNRRWVERGHERMPDGLWRAAVNRVRSEFDEMPCLRVTLTEARALFGLPGSPCEGLLRRLREEGFLSCADDGTYVRTTAAP